MENESMGAASGQEAAGAVSGLPAQEAGTPADGVGGAAEGNGGSEESGAAFSEAGGSDGEGDGGAASGGTTPPKAERTPEDRQRDAEFARRRREAEVERRIEEARTQARADATIAALGGVNPYTHGEMKDAHDVRIYERMRRIHERGGDPVADFAASEAEEAREAAETARQAAESRERYDRELADFAAAHPDVSVKELLADPDFGEYAEGKIGKKSLSELYDGYNRFVGKFRADADRRVEEERDRMAQRVANAQASPGAASVGGDPAPEFFTREQVAAMSQSEVTKNLDKIYASQKRW